MPHVLHQLSLRRKRPHEASGGINQSRRRIFSPITAAAIAYKKALAGNFDHQLVTVKQGVNIAGTPHWGTSPRRYRAHTACKGTRLSLPAT